MASKNNHEKSTGTEPIQQTESDMNTGDIADVPQESGTPELFSASASVNASADWGEVVESPEPLPMLSRNDGEHVDVPAADSSRGRWFSLPACS